GWLVDIVRQVFSDREIIAPGRYCAYNAFAGLILLAAAILMWVEPRFGSPRGGVGAAVAGMLLVSSVPVVLVRPSAVAKLLFTHGVLFILLGVWFAADAVRWAVGAPPHGPFRYATGIAITLIPYGGLTVDGFGWSVVGSSGRLRVVTACGRF